MNRRLQFSLKGLLVATAVLGVAASFWRKEAEEPLQRISVSNLGTTHVLTGKTHRPLGEMSTLTGLVIDGPSKGYDDGPNVRVQFINGEATQEIIELKIAASFGSFHVKNLDDPESPPASEYALPMDLAPRADQPWLMWHSKLLDSLLSPELGPAR